MAARGAGKFSRPANVVGMASIGVAWNCAVGPRGGLAHVVGKARTAWDCRWLKEARTAIVPWLYNGFSWSAPDVWASRQPGERVGAEEGVRFRPCVSTNILQMLRFTLVLLPLPLIDPPAEWWPSGRRHTPAKGAGGKPSRGFESLPLRHKSLKRRAGPRAATLCAHELREIAPQYPCAGSRHRLEPAPDADL